MGIKQWNLPNVEEEQIRRLADETDLSSLLCRILCARGYGGAQEVQAFLSEDTALSSPYRLLDMDKAVERVRLAVHNGERLAVFGDYDCDGITSTALMTGYLQDIGADVIFYVPQREQEGYGMNLPAVDFLYSQNVSLIITVDNGVSSHEEIAYAKTLGIDVIVTDHHTPRETLPDAVAVINPHRKDCPSGLTELAGVGVAFKLVCALEGDENGDEMLEYYSDLVALGTVADVVPLTGENRAIVRHGLQLLCQSERVGINALLACCGGEKALTSESIAFTLAPRLNASGRLDSVDSAIELLLTDDVRYAGEIAGEIETLNARRKTIEDQMAGEISVMLAENPQLLQDRLLFLCGEEWHHGVVGIVASKMLETTGKPTLLFSLDGEYARGSARSLPGFSMIEAVAACSEHLVRYGGHAMAAGMTLPREKLPEFIQQMQRYAREHSPHMPVASIDIDCVLPPEELTVANIASVAVLEPFGAGNKSPVYLLRNLQITRLTPTADGKHLRLQLTAGNQSVNAIHFRMKETEFPYIPGDTVDIVASINLSPYNGKTYLSVIVRDIRPSGVDQQSMIADSLGYESYLREEWELLEEANDLLPTRDDIAVVYRYLRRAPFAHDSVALFYRLADSGIPYGKLLIALDVMDELGLTTRNDGVISCPPNPAKVDLDTSEILQKIKDMATQKVR